MNEKPILFSGERVRTDMEQEVYEKYRVLMLKGHQVLGEATSREVFTFILDERIGIDDKFCDSFRRRSEELEKDGFLKFLGWRKCRISGKRAKVYGFERQEKNLLPGFAEACQKPSN
jgi:hypothetical protein